MEDISGFASLVQLAASNTFPEGITLSQFADDTDPFDIPSMKIGDTAMGLNGDLVRWSSANPAKISISVIPGSEDDLNLQVLLDSNRVGKGKQSARDEINITVLYPDGSTTSLTQGTITDGMPGTGVASAGRKKTPVYQFAFENVSRSGA